MDTKPATFKERIAALKPKQWAVIAVGAIVLVYLFGSSDRSEIEEAVREILVDPDSAQFGDIVKYTGPEDAEMACIMVNARNKMGGYTGYSATSVIRGSDGNWHYHDDMESIDCSYYSK